MVQLMQILADSIYFFFVAFETMLFELDAIMFFGFTTYDWSIVLIIISWVIGLIADLMGMDLTSFIGNGDLFND